MEYQQAYNNVEVIGKYLKEKTTNLKILDISQKVEYCKFMVFCSVCDEDINRQLLTEFSAFLSENKIKVVRTDGQIKGEWIVLDLESIIVHIFSRDLQAKYNLEKFWKDSKTKEINI